LTQASDKKVSELRGNLHDEAEVGGVTAAISKDQGRIVGVNREAVLVAPEADTVAPELRGAAKKRSRGFAVSRRFAAAARCVATG